MSGAKNFTDKISSRDDDKQEQKPANSRYLNNNYTHCCWSQNF